MTKGAKPVVLSVMPTYCDKFIPCAVSLNLPSLLTDLYKPSNLKLGYFDLLKISNETVLSVEDEQRKAVELNTRDQSKNMLWFRVRAGRITACNFKVVCHTDLASPSLSLITRICHPDKVHIKSVATIWACEL